MQNKSENNNDMRWQNYLRVGLLWFLVGTAVAAISFLPGFIIQQNVSSAATGQNAAAIDVFILAGLWLIALSRDFPIAVSVLIQLAIPLAIGIAVALAAVAVFWLYGLIKNAVVPTPSLPDDSNDSDKHDTDSVDEDNLNTLEQATPAGQLTEEKTSDHKAENLEDLSIADAVPKLKPSDMDDVTFNGIIEIIEIIKLFRANGKHIFIHSKAPAEEERSATIQQLQQSFDARCAVFEECYCSQRAIDVQHRIIFALYTSTLESLQKLKATNDDLDPTIIKDFIENDQNPMVLQLEDLNHYYARYKQLLTIETQFGADIQSITNFAMQIHAVVKKQLTCTLLEQRKQEIVEAVTQPLRDQINLLESEISALRQKLKRYSQPKSKKKLSGVRQQTFQSKVIAVKNNIGNKVAQQEQLALQLDAAEQRMRNSAEVLALDTQSQTLRDEISTGSKTLKKQYYTLATRYHSDKTGNVPAKDNGLFITTVNEAYGAIAASKDNNDVGEIEERMHELEQKYGNLLWYYQELEKNNSAGVNDANAQSVSLALDDLSLGPCRDTLTPDLAQGVWTLVAYNYPATHRFDGQQKDLSVVNDDDHAPRMPNGMR